MEREQESEIISNRLAESGTLDKLVVITVWYNRADYVEESIGSLLNQTADDYTIFAVDDGSTDGTGEKLDEMLTKAEEEDVPMRVWRKPNEGFVTSIKRAIEEKTENEIIALHGAGDLSKPTRLQTQLTMLEEDESVIATGVGVEKINAEGDYISEKIPPKWPESDPFVGIVPRLGTHGASMYYRDSYEEAGGYREHFVYAQDTDLLLRLSECGKFLNSTEVLYSKLVSEKTVSSNSDWKQNLEQIIYSAAALESARRRKQGKPDPISSIKPGDWDEIKSIAKQNGLHHRAVRRCGMLAEQCIRNANALSILIIVHFIGIVGFFTILTCLPNYLLNLVSTKSRLRLPFK